MGVFARSRENISRVAKIQPSKRLGQAENYPKYKQTLFELARCPNTNNVPSNVKILFVGDVVGEPGRKALREALPRLRAEHGLALVIANGENAAGGAGITRNTANELFEAGVDIITTGDHVWDQKEALALLTEEPRILRPINYPPGVPGQGSIVWQPTGHPPVAVINIQGRVFMGELENPFLAAKTAVDAIRNSTPIIIVDIHAEATSEKIALARFLDGQVSAVLGTHTHVQTADEQILPGGTAFICDVGFTGAHESVIGRKIEPVLKRFLTGLPQKFEVAKGNPRVQGVILEIDPGSGAAKSITRISLEVPSRDKLHSETAPSCH